MGAILLLHDRCPSEFVSRNPVATKRAVRAILKATDICAREPERAARYIVAKGYEPRYEIALEVIRSLSYNRWRTYNPEDTLRFYALRLHDVGMIKSNPQKLIAQGTDWRFVNELKRELKASTLTYSKETACGESAKSRARPPRFYRGWLIAWGGVFACIARSCSCRAVARDDQAQDPRKRRLPVSHLRSSRRSCCMPRDLKTCSTSSTSRTLSCWPPEDLLAGEVDITFTFSPTDIRFIDAGAPVAILAAAHTGCVELIASDRIRSTRDLRGKNSRHRYRHARTSSPCLWRTLAWTLRRTSTGSPSRLGSGCRSSPKGRSTPS